MDAAANNTANARPYRNMTTDEIKVAVMDHRLGLRAEWKAPLTEEKVAAMVEEVRKREAGEIVHRSTPQVDWAGVTVARPRLGRM